MGLDKLQENAVVRIIDDDDSMRKSWRFLIEGEGWATKCYSSALRFLEEDDRSVLGCAILDVRMPDMSGIELQRVMMLQKNGLPIIFVSGHGDIDMAVQALKTAQWIFFRNLSARTASWRPLKRLWLRMWSAVNRLSSGTNTGMFLIR